MEWMNTGSNQKSVGEVERLAKEVICAEDFKAADLAGFSVGRENRRFDKSEAEGGETPFSADGWKESTVEISVPTGIRMQGGATGGLNFSIPGLHHRSLLAIMKAALTDVTATRFHFSPFKRFWKPSSGPEVRCFDEIYTADAFLEADDKLQKQQNEPDCNLEKVVLGLMFWSDS
jgi:hypothetical protein